MHDSSPTLRPALLLGLPALRPFSPVWGSPSFLTVPFDSGVSGCC